MKKQLVLDIHSRGNIERKKDAEAFVPDVI